MENISVMYHNVLGYNQTVTDVTARADALLALYENASPDILCLQEMTGKTGDANNNFRAHIVGTELEAWLYENYNEICHDDGDDQTKYLENDGGRSTPIFYRKDAGLTLEDSGYVRARQAATKGTTWAVFKTAEGNRFCISNSHFVSPTEQGASTNIELMRQYRADDTNVWLTKLASLELQCPIVSGGDLNSPKAYATSSTYATPTALMQSAGYTILGTVEGTVGDGVVKDFDHVLAQGAFGGIKYEFIGSSAAQIGSDHAPQIVNIKFNLSK